VSTDKRVSYALRCSSLCLLRERLTCTVLPATSAGPAARQAPAGHAHVALAGSAGSTATLLDPAATLTTASK